VVEQTASGQGSSPYAPGTPVQSPAKPAPRVHSLPLWLEKTLVSLAPLWVAGVAVMVVAISLIPAAHFISRGSRIGIWIPYLALGIVFPAAMALVLRWLQFGNCLPTMAKRALILLAMIAPVAMARPADVLSAAGLAAVQAAICMGFMKSRSFSVYLALLAVGAGSWLIMLKLFVWEPMPTAYPTSWHLLLIGIVLLYSCCWWTFRAVTARDGTLSPAADALAIGLLILLAFRTDGLFQTDRVAPTGSFYHWGAAIGPAEAVRQGGAVLWDTPSPYGFLLPLTIAAFPAATTWQSLFLLNALCTAVLALCLYLVIRHRAAGLPGIVFSWLLSAAAVFLVAMYPPLLLPEHYYPMAGAFRYGWCYVLLGVLLLEWTTRGSQSRKWVLAGGSICWVLSNLWSPESAFFGSLVWLPAYAIIVLRDHVPVSRNWRRIAAWLLLPVALFAVSVGVVFAAYQVRIGHGPDLQSYFEVVLSFGSSQVAQTSELFGPTDFADTALVLVFGVVLFAIAVVMFIRSDAWRAVPLAVGLLFGTWALLAYPVSQPFLFASYRLLPFMVLGIGVILALIDRSSIARYTEWTRILRMMMVPVLTTILVTAYTNLPQGAYYAQAIRDEAYLGTDVTAGLPEVEDSLQRLLVAADVHSSDPLWYEGTSYGETLPVWKPQGQSPVLVSRQWLAGPLSSMVYLSDDRKQTYLARAADRRLEGGWLVQPRDRTRLQFSVGPWFYEQVNQTHVPTRFASNDDWQLIWFEPRLAVEGTESSALEVLWEPGVTDDIRVNGENLTSSVLPRLWGAWGKEWSSPVPDQPGRCAPGQGTVHLFSDKPRKVTVKLRQPATRSMPLTVRVNGDIRAATGRRGADKDTLSVLLQQGWNTVEISLPRGETEIGGAMDPESCVAEILPEHVLRIDRIDVRIR
jgi:hypothetical protein